MWVLLPGLVIESIGIVLLIAALVTTSLTGMIAGICLIATGIVVHIVRIAGNMRSGGELQEPKRDPDRHRNQTVIR